MCLLLVQQLVYMDVVPSLCIKNIYCSCHYEIKTDCQYHLLMFECLFFNLFIENSQYLQLTIYKTSNYTNKQQHQQQKIYKKLTN